MQGDLIGRVDQNGGPELIQLTTDGACPPEPRNAASGGRGAGWHALVVTSQSSGWLLPQGVLI